jgi:Tol biopolymer transport system component
VARSWPSVAVTAALFAFLVLAPTAHGAFPGRNGFIAYVHSSHSSDEEGLGPTNSGLSLMAGPLLGGDRYTLRSCTRVDGVPQDSACANSASSPAYSPDGRRLVVDAGTQLAILDSDGSDFRLLPPQTADDGEPVWAPDGKRIAFTGVPAGQTSPDLFVLNIAKGTSRRLTTTGGRSPAWSSRNRIAYVTRYSSVISRPPRGQLAIVKPDGSGHRKLTRKGGLVPAWSPHATKIAFVRKGHLYVMDANGEQLRRVGGRRPISADDVAWSPNGRLLAYHAFESGILVVRADGTDEREFELGATSANAAYDSSAPDWQPLPRRRRQ